MQQAVSDSPISLRTLRRSMVVSATASAIGMGLAAVVGGNIFSRFLEYAGYYKYLYIFLAVVPLSNLLQIFGAWALQRTGWRRLFFYVFLGPPRLLWILIVMLPSIPMPEGIFHLRGGMAGIEHYAGRTGVSTIPPVACQR